jgi:hypothetical protein
MTANNIRAWRLEVIFVEFRQPTGGHAAVIGFMPLIPCVPRYCTGLFG